MNISLKSKINYWFLFLRLAHQSSDPTIRSNLTKSKSIYDDWGDYLKVPFDVWWKTHSHLFKVSSTISKLSEPEAIEHGYLYLKIPLTYSPSTVGELAMDFYAKEQNKLSKNGGKVKRVYGGRFELTAIDMQTSQFDYYLRFARDVYIPLMNQGVKGTKDYRLAAVEAFKKQKLKSSRNKDEIKRQIPFIGTSQDTSNLNRLTTRYKKYSSSLLLNVSLGVFPGEYEETGTKNQVEKRRSVYKPRNFEKGPAESRFIEKKVRDDPVDPYRKKVKS